MVACVYIYIYYTMQQKKHTFCMSATAAADSLTIWSQNFTRTSTSSRTFRLGLYLTNTGKIKGTG